jgi:hypothetical protein
MHRLSVSLPRRATAVAIGVIASFALAVAGPSIAAARSSQPPCDPSQADCAASPPAKGKSKAKRRHRRKTTAGTKRKRQRTTRPKRQRRTRTGTTRKRKRTTTGTTHKRPRKTKTGVKRQRKSRPPTSTSGPGASG